MCSVRPLVACVVKASLHASRVVPFPLISSRLVRYFTPQNSFQSHRLDGVDLACSASRSLPFQFVIHEQTTLVHSNLYPKVRDSVKYTALRKFVGSMGKRPLSVSDCTGVVVFYPSHVQPLLGEDADTTPCPKGRQSGVVYVKSTLFQRAPLRRIPRWFARVASTRSECRARWHHFRAQSFPYTTVLSLHLIDRHFLNRSDRCPPCVVSQAPINLANIKIRDHVWKFTRSHSPVTRISRQHS
jgi:hypothetical protein